MIDEDRRGSTSPTLLRGAHGGAPGSVGVGGRGGRGGIYDKTR